jgi:tetratricopeptide (TPR) repeat protein
LLAYHFNRAIDDATEAPEVVAKAATYCGKAGQQALQSGAHREAADFLQQALHWDHALTDAWADRAGPFTPADDPPAHLRRASWERMLGDAYIGVGDMEAGRAHLETALRLLGRPLPQGKARLVLELVGQGLRQALHRLRPGRHLGRLAHSRAAVLETVRAYERLGEINFFLNDALRTLHCTVHGLNLAEIAGPSAELARISGSVAVTAGLMSLHGLARLYCHQAIEVAHQVDQLPAQAWAYMATALYNAGIGRWEEVQKTIEPALTLWSRLGARRYWEASAVVSAMTIAFHHGDFETSTRLFADIVESGRRGDNAQAHSWGLLGLAENALRLGKTEEAHDWLQAATILLPRHIGSTEELRLHALTALTYHRLERHADARHHLALAMNLVGTTSPTAYYALEAYSAVVEVALAQWQSKAISAAQLHKAIAGLKSFARIFPIARPRALLWRGQYCLLSKRPSGARRLWRKGLAVADRLSMPYEQRLLHESMSGAEVSHR